MKDRAEQLGQAAYEAYAGAVGGRSVRSEVLPPWAELGDRIQTAWEVAAEAVRRHSASSSS